MRSAACAHHWQIETPTGKPKVRATCRRCGAERLYPAGFSDAQRPGEPLRMYRKRLKDAELRSAFAGGEP